MDERLTAQMSLVDLELLVLLQAADPPVSAVAEALTQAHSLAREVVCSIDVMPHDIARFIGHAWEVERRFFPGLWFRWDFPENRVWDDELLWQLIHPEPPRRTSRKRPGPPKGRPLKVRVGGDWTPQALKAELARLGLSEVKLAKMLCINPKSVNKWSRTAIPDDRQEEITVVLKAYEEGLS